MWNEDYARRASELGHGIISSCEHGWQGRYIECYELAKKYGLKFVFSAEAYWVKDRFEKDRSNCHIFMAARNENGRRAINDILSEACLTGYYGQPRIDIPLIMSLPPEDVILTTACVAYWKYDDIEDITKQFHEHFGRNLFLEVQYHNTQKQKELNRRIMDVSARFNIPLIMGCDSHYILPEQEGERSSFIESKGMKYEDESGWYMDYPDGDTAYKRFQEQCVLPRDEIIEAINNTNVFLEVEEYDCPCFTKEIKMPTLYPQLAQAERDAKYDELVDKAWAREKKNIDESLWGTYEKEIGLEKDIVHRTFHADYFLVDHAIVKKGKEKGGVITPTGRGSGVSFYTNKLLGFTDVDRVAAKVKMYPERFMSPTRILEAKTLADLDLNLGGVSVFAEAQEEVLGEGHAYPMVTYGTMKPKAAWKMYAKSQGVDFDLANKVSEQIDKYEIALKHASEDEHDDIDILDYIDPNLREIYKASEIYQGIVVSSSIHPCSYLLYQGDIRREIGLMRAKDTVVCLMDGKWAEEYKFLKNDLLKVSVVDLIDRVYKAIGIPRHSIKQLLDMCPADSKVWDVYKKGCTLGINQCEQPGTRQRVMKYAPTTISELCAFVAAIRPGFKSMYKTFESRKPFKYNIPSLDNLIQTDEMPNSFILYQEMGMAVLNYAGIPMSECYEIIKNIAKKRVDKVLKYREQFLRDFSIALCEKDGKSEDVATQTSEQVWQILEDSSRYLFNASHSYCVALDSLYGAFLKTNYPVQFYETFLRILEEKGEKDRMAAVKDEAEAYFGIRFPPYKFGQDNRTITGNLETKEITNSIKAIKGFGDAVGETLYQCGLNKFESFVDVLSWLDTHSLKESKYIPLIQVGYFDQFGNISTLMRIAEMFALFKGGAAKSFRKDKKNPYEHIMPRFASDRNAKGDELKSWSITDCKGLMQACEESIRMEKNLDIPFRAKATLQLGILGYIDIVTNKREDRRKLYLTDVVPLKSKSTDTPWAYAVFGRSIGTGRISRWTVRTYLYNKDPVDKGQVIYIPADKYHQDKKSGYWYLDGYTILEK